MIDDRPMNEDPPGTFDDWMRLVDRVMRIHTGGFSTSDFPDYGFRDAFRDAVTPVEVVEAILAGEGWMNADTDISTE